MSAVLVTPPAVEPVSLADAKHHLRIEHGDDDELIGDLIAAARLHIEAETRRALITQTWRRFLDRRPDGGRLVLRPSPVQSIASVAVYDADDTMQIVDPGAYLVDTASVPARFVFKTGMPLGATRELNGIEIEFVAGYGDTADDVPMPLRQAILRLINHWYEHREAVSLSGTGGYVPVGLEALIAGFRVPLL